ncbi:MAG: FG-GAP-like repeat-containing protein [Planctomycetota bacterium]
MDEAELDQLVARYVEARDEGSPLSADDLVAEKPELRPVMLARIAALEQLEGMLITLRTPPAGAEPEAAGTPMLGGRFQIIGEIGRGAFGRVFRARDRVLAREVALKFIEPPAGLSAPHLAVFLREARALASVNHENVVTLHDVGDLDGRPCLCMELLKGHTLKDRLQGGPMPVSTAIAIGVDICCGVHAIHGAGLIHRDIKPANIFLGALDRAKILDFGIGIVDSVEHHGVAGSPAYMSPEQAFGRPLDRRSDVYAIGVVLHEMLAGSRPVGPPLASPEVALSAPEREDLRRVRPDLSAELAGVVRRALEPDPGRRFATAAALAASLRSLPESREPRPKAARSTVALVLGVLLVATISFAVLREITRIDRLMELTGVDSYLVGRIRPQTLVAGDFDGDGSPDVAVALRDYEKVSVMRNEGTGRLVRLDEYKVNSYPRGIASADLNGDGWMDLAVSNHGHRTISILFNRGDGTFTKKRDCEVGERPQSVMAADLNGDGRHDLVSADTGPNVDRDPLVGVSVLINNGDGSFAPAARYLTSARPTSVAVGDLDGDLQSDIAIGDMKGSVSLARNQGHGRFRLFGPFPVGAQACGIAIADLHGEKGNEVAVTDVPSGEVVVLRCNSLGDLEVVGREPVGLQPNFLAAADFDRDGRVDLAVCNCVSGTVSVLLNRGDGKFEHRHMAVGKEPGGIDVADFDRNGWLDLAVVNYGSEDIAILLHLDNEFFGIPVW